jgi:hypothetical protein
MPLKCETNMLQDPTEFYRFLDVIRKSNVKSYLEIGCKHGGTVWRIANVLPKGSRIVAVDLPHGDGSFKDSEPNLKACCEELKHRGYDVHLHLADSTTPDTITKVRALSPFDLCFIDGNHTARYCRSDWSHYGQMAKIVAFHDIGFDEKHWRSKGWNNKASYSNAPIEVPALWAELKKKYAKHQEIKLCPHTNGIGILWREQAS